MTKKGRPSKGKTERGLYTVAVPKELYNQIHDLAIGSDMSLTAVASILLTKGLDGVHIVEETVTRKRLVTE